MENLLSQFTDVQLKLELQLRAETGKTDFAKKWLSDNELQIGDKCIFLSDRFYRGTLSKVDKDAVYFTAGEIADEPFIYFKNLPVKLEEYIQSKYGKCLTPIISHNSIYSLLYFTSLKISNLKFKQYNGWCNFIINRTLPICYRVMKEGINVDEISENKIPKYVEFYSNSVCFHHIQENGWYQLISEFQ